MSDAAWAHLPNAKHIDAVLADVKARPEAWTTARDAVRGVARTAAWDAARAAVRGVARTAAWDAARAAALASAWGAAWDVLVALIAWDSAADLLECTPDVLRAMIDMASPPVCHQAALLLPYAIVRSADKQEVT